MRNFMFLLIIISALGCKVKPAEWIDVNRIPSSLSNDELIQNGDFYYQKDEFEKAIKYYDLLIDERNFQTGELYFKRGYCHALLLNLEESTINYLMAAKFGYRVGDAFYNAGINQTLELNDSLAVIYFENSLQYNPNDSSATFELVKAKERINKVQEVFRNLMQNHVENY